MEKEQKSINPLNDTLNFYKGCVLAEFEKVCPTDRSFERIKKDMHNIFDDLERDLGNKFNIGG
jgi:hypothetical protein